MIHSLSINIAAPAVPAMPGVAQPGVETAEMLDFSALLAGLTPGDATAAETAPVTDVARIVPLPGIALPLAAKGGGKILPDALPKANDTESDLNDTEPQLSGKEALAEVIAMPILPLPLPLPLPQPATTVDVAPSIAASAPPPIPREQPAPAAASSGNSGTAQPAVAISIAPVTSPDPTAATATPSLPEAAKAAAPLPVAASPEAPLFDMAMAAPAPLATAPATPAMPVSDAAQDVARIVEQLAVARAAFAPASAALSIDHADFGEISLRFDQRADGALAVQVSAASGEAHRAISAALAAQGGQMSSHDGQPHQHYAPGTEREGRGTSSGQNGHQSAQRQDQPSRNPQPRNAPQRGASRNDGVFA